MDQAQGTSAEGLLQSAFGGRTKKRRGKPSPNKPITKKTSISLWQTLGLSPQEVVLLTKGKGANLPPFSPLQPKRLNKRGKSLNESSYEVLRKKCATLFFKKYLRKYSPDLDVKEIPKDLFQSVRAETLLDGSYPSTKAAFMSLYGDEQIKRTGFDPCIKFVIEKKEKKKGSLYTINDENFGLTYKIFGGDKFREGDNLKIWYLKGKPNLLRLDFDGHLCATIERDGYSEIASFGFGISEKNNVSFISIDKYFENKLSNAWNQAWRKSEGTGPDTHNLYSVFNGFADLRANVALTAEEASTLNTFVTSVADQLKGEILELVTPLRNNLPLMIQNLWQFGIKYSYGIEQPLQSYAYDQMNCILPNYIQTDDNERSNCLGSLERLFPDAFTCLGSWGRRYFSLCRAFEDRKTECDEEDQ